jgi:beta-ketoacyl-acyl-carrier-protein synthase II
MQGSRRSEPAQGRERRERRGRRVVVTGLGAVTPSGLDMARTWESVRDGRSGIRTITRFDTSGYNVKIAGEIPEFDPLAYMTLKEARRNDRTSQFAIAAAEQAIAEAKLEIGPHNAYDIGIYLGCGAGGIETYVPNQRALDARGPRALSPLLIPMIVIDAGAVQIGIRHGIRGPNLGLSSACSSSLDTVGMACEVIRRGDATVMLAGGTEAAVNPLGIGGFDRMGALSRRNDAPHAASRPFDLGRDGFVLSEGGCMLVLEDLEHARARGAQPLCEILSYASTSDGRHLTAPDLHGHAAVECIRRALARAGLAVDQVDHLAAHGTGTPIGDPIEANVIRTAFGPAHQRMFVSATKGSTGHLLGAAGALTTALTACAIRDSVLPPTLNLTDPDPTCDLLHVANVAKATDIRTALVSSYGFGGHNTCLVLGAVE